MATRMSNSLWERFTTWWFLRRTQRALASPVAPLDLVEEPENVTFDDLVMSLQLTSAVALGAAVGVEEADGTARWLWASDEASEAALKAAVWRGGVPRALLAAYPDPDDDAICRLYVRLPLRRFRDLVNALRTT
jgi:hypothetical protein